MTEQPREGYRLDPEPTVREHVEGYGFASVEQPATGEAARPPGPKAHKDEWVAYAISRGIPSYEASGMTIEELKESTGA